MLDRVTKRESSVSRIAYKSVDDQRFAQAAERYLVADRNSFNALDSTLNRKTPVPSDTVDNLAAELQNAVTELRRSAFAYVHGPEGRLPIPAARVHRWIDR
jgi:hypothetical protein